MTQNTKVNFSSPEALDIQLEFSDTADSRSLNVSPSSVGSVFSKHSFPVSPPKNMLNITFCSNKKEKQKDTTWKEEKTRQEIPEVNLKTQK